ncbi:MAG TPA: tripartite tricarboxylate transporter TctB family protein [Burkholderiales bacterium]|jgi:putative tricarboxylic transport membrane protein
MRAAKADFWSGLALGGLGAYIIVTASRWEYLGADGPGPGFFPLWFGIAMAGLSLLLMVFSVKEKHGETISWSGAGRAFSAWAALALSVAALKLVGFLVSFAALTFFIVAVMYRRPYRVAAVVGIAGAAGFYVVFALALGVKLP